MNGFDQVWLKYEDQGLLDGLESLDDVNRISRSRWALVFSTRTTLPMRPLVNFKRAKRTFR